MDEKGTKNTQPFLKTPKNSKLQVNPLKIKNSQITVDEFSKENYCENSLQTVKNSNIYNNNNNIEQLNLNIVDKPQITQKQETRKEQQIKKIQAYFDDFDYSNDPKHLAGITLPDLTLEEIMEVIGCDFNNKSVSKNENIVTDSPKKIVRKFFDSIICLDNPEEVDLNTIVIEEFEKSPTNFKSIYKTIESKLKTGSENCLFQHVTRVNTEKITEIEESEIKNKEKITTNENTINESENCCNGSEICIEKNAKEGCPENSRGAHFKEVSGVALNNNNNITIRNGNTNKLPLRQADNVTAPKKQVNNNIRKSLTNKKDCNLETTTTSNEVENKKTSPQVKKYQLRYETNDEKQNNQAVKESTETIKSVNLINGTETLSSETKNKGTSPEIKKYQLRNRNSNGNAEKQNNQTIKKSVGLEIKKDENLASGKKMKKPQIYSTNQIYNKIITRSQVNKTTTEKKAARINYSCKNSAETPESSKSDDFGEDSDVERGKFKCDLESRKSFRVRKKPDFFDHEQFTKNKNKKCRKSSREKRMPDFYYNTLHF